MTLSVIPTAAGDQVETVTFDDGVEVAYVDQGAGSGPTLLLVHGLGASREVWNQCLPHLRRRHRVIAVDLPGFGASPADPQLVTIAAFARVAEQLCRHLDLESVVAIGNSLGGWVSAELALRAPDLVDGLVLLDAAGILPTRRERFKVVTMLSLADRMSPIGIRARPAMISQPRLRRRALSFMFADAGALSPDAVASVLPETQSPVFRDVLNAAVRSWSASWLDRVGELEIPSLIIWGEKDKQLPLRHGEQWHGILRNSRLVVLPDTGHLPQVERPGQTLQEIDSFLGELAVSAD